MKLAAALRDERAPSRWHFATPVDCPCWLVWNMVCSSENARPEGKGLGNVKQRRRGSLHAVPKFGDQLVAMPTWLKANHFVYRQYSVGKCIFAHQRSYEEKGNKGGEGGKGLNEERETKKSFYR